MREYNSELFPAIARDHIGLSNKFSYDVSHFLQHHIPCPVAVSIIYLFKVIYVHHYDGKGCVIPERPVKLFLKPCVEKVMVI